MARIFLSYGHDEHISLALRLKEDLVSRGHEVWFDVDRLKPGSDWETYVEEGIEWAAAVPSEGRVVLVMTPHSVRRPDGYCLNEVARAVSRGLGIVPVMLVWCEPPLSICRIQWLDMRDCVPLVDQIEKYEAKFETLNQALGSEGPEFEGAYVRLSQLLEPLPFEADILPHLAGFSGRQWLLDRVRDWLADPAAPQLFWITGSPGVGKTAVAAWLSHRNPDVAAVHLCARGHSLKADPRRCVLSLAYQLASQLPDYQTRLNSLNLEQLAGEQDARTLFDLLISQPLSGNFPRPPRDVMVVVDGLDEAGADGVNPLATLLASELPKTPSWLRLIVTSSPTNDMLYAFQGFTPFALDAGSAENRQDLHEYLLKALQAIVGHDAASTQNVNHILDRSEGLFLYVHWVLRDLSLRQLSLDRPEEVPQGLGGVYAGYFEREFPDVRRYQEVIRPVLETMAAAREPLSFDQLAGVLGWDDYHTQQGRGLLGSLFPSPDDVPRPFHGSVMEWLAAVSKAGPFYISPKEGQKRLARFAWEEYQRPGRVRDPYVVRHAVVHLRLAGELEKAFTLLQDDAYLAEFIRVASPDVLREELFQCWSAAEKTGQEESVLAHARSAACMSRGMYRARTEDVGRAITSFEEMPDQPSVVLDALRWNELCWLTKDYAPDRRPESLDIALRSLRLAGERLADDRCASLVAEVHRSAGWLFKDMNRPDDAEEVFKEALRIFERLDLTRQVAWTERDLGCLYRDLGRRKLAEQFLRQSEEAFRRLGDRRQLSVSLKDLGILSLEKASADRSTLGAQAALYFEEALELAEMLREHELVAWLLRYQGIAEGMQGRVEHGRKLIAGARSRFKQFPESNQALCDFVSQHLTEVRRPHLLELFGYLAATNAADLPQLLQ